MNKKKNSNIPSQEHRSPSRDGTVSTPRVSDVRPPPTLEYDGAEKVNLIYSSDVHLTIQLKVTEFSRRDATLLAGQALYLVAKEGISLGDWMLLEWLYNYLLGSKTEVYQLRDSKELELTLLLKIVLLSGAWLGLDGKVQLPEDIKDLIGLSRWVPTDRTYQSRKGSFHIRKFFSVRIVSVDYLSERSKNTLRYSSYTRGYGEGGRTARKAKTRPSAELDGEPVDIEKEKSINFPLSRLQYLFELTAQELRYTNRQRR